jgi:hypothetical protein
MPVTRITEFYARDGQGDTVKQRVSPEASAEIRKLLADTPSGGYYRG